MRCSCQKFSTGSLVQRWQARALAVSVRLVKHGRRVDVQRMSKTVSLIHCIDHGLPAAWDEAHRGRSHHLPTCEWKRREATLDTVSS